MDQKENTPATEETLNRRIAELAIHAAGIIHAVGDLGPTDEATLYRALFEHGTTGEADATMKALHELGFVFRSGSTTVALTCKGKRAYADMRERDRSKLQRVK